MITHQPRMVWWPLKVVSMMLVMLSLQPRLLAHGLTIDFEDLPPQTIVTTQYVSGGFGVLFHEERITAGTARSGTRSLLAPFVAEFTRSLTFEFTGSQRAVSFFGSCLPGFGPFEAVLTAFDQAGNIITSDGPKHVICGNFQAFFSVMDASTSIRRIGLHSPGNPSIDMPWLIDDLTIEGPAPPPPPSEPPEVNISSPIGGTFDLVSGTVQVAGVVRGSDILSAQLRVVETRPPRSTAPSINLPIDLVPTGKPNEFAFMATIGPVVFMGPTQIIVEATNVAGLRGFALVSILNIVPQVAEQCGPRGPLGNLRFSVPEGPCNIAACNLGGVAASADELRQIPLPILEKWLNVNDRRLSESGTLGCPITDAMDDVGGAQRQDFEWGRLYDLRTGPTSLSYVARVIADAIDVLGGQAATGLPVSDPLEDRSGSVPTWYFQRFHRPGTPAETLDSTLEIRGHSPILTLERQGGDLSEFTLAELTLNANTTTIWQSFPCERRGAGFICAVAPSPSGPPLESANLLFCGIKFTPLPRAFPNVPKQWVAVINNETNTPVLGWIRSRSPDVTGKDGSHMAGADNPLVHQNYQPVSGALEGWPSDWNFHIIPLRPFWNLLGGNFRTKNFEIEIEEYFIHYWREFVWRFFDVTDRPRGGDLLFANGRWIVDCGHTSGNTEIHPPSILAVMRTDYPFSRPATRAEILVNGFFNGGQVLFSLYPPPRPTPSSRLFITKPRDDADGSFDVKVDYDFLIDHVRLRFSSSPRTNPVTAFGEMKYRSARGYAAEWHVVWSE